MIIEQYNENFEKVEVEVEDYMITLMESLINEGLFDLERSPIVTNDDGSKIFISVEKPGRKLNEENDNYRITIEKII